MRKHVLPLSLVFIFAASGLSLAAPKKPSKLSEFAGKYSGTVFATAGSTSLAGTATGTISASKKQESGQVTLNSVVFVNSGGSPTAIAETYILQKSSFVYLLSIAGSGTASGGGGLHVGKTSINYIGTVNSSGDTFTISGTMRKGKRNLLITETLSNSTSTTTFLYNLRKKGKK